MTMHTPTFSSPSDTDQLACSQAIAHFYALLDGLTPGSVGAMLASDGVWHRQGAVLRGAAEVDKALGQRPDGRISLHLVSNLRMEAVGDGQIKARYLIQAYRHDRSPQEAQDVPAPLPNGLLAVTSNEDLWTMEPANGWRLSHKASKVLFLHTDT